MLRETLIFIWRACLFLAFATFESVIGLPIISLSVLLDSASILQRTSYLLLLTTAVVTYSVLFVGSLGVASLITISCVLLFSTHEHPVKQQRLRALGSVLGSIALAVLGNMVFTNLVVVYACLVIGGWWFVVRKKSPLSKGLLSMSDMRGWGGS